MASSNTRKRLIYSWGSNASGLLLTGDRVDRFKPELIDLDNFINQHSNSCSVQDAIEQATPENHNTNTSGLGDQCTLKTSGAFTIIHTSTTCAVGDFLLSQQCNGNLPSIHILKFPSSLKIEQVNVGWTCASFISSSGDLYMCGSNASGQCGLPSRRRFLSEPTKVDLPPNINNNDKSIKVIQVAHGWKHNLVLSSDGVVWGFGSNVHNQLTSNTGKTLHPQIVSENKKIRQIAAGMKFSLLLDDRNIIWGRGNNSFSQLGLCSVKKCAEWVRIEPLLSDQDVQASRCDLSIKSMVCGWHHCIILLSIGRVFAWGRSDLGQCGVVQQSTQVVSLDVRPVNNGVEADESRMYYIKAINASAESSYLLTEKGELWSCGWNEHGNLGHSFDQTNDENQSKSFSASLKKVEFSKKDAVVESIEAGGASVFAICHPNEVSIGKSPL